jgi:aminoglycoside phosphotransferase (APT) family kinase protein
MEYTFIEREAGSFQKPLPAERIVAMCRRAFGQVVGPQNVRELGAGMFNNTYVVEMSGGPRYILRVGPHPSSYVFSNETSLLRREYTIQPYLGAVAQVVPRTLYADFSGEIIDRDYVFQSYIEGELWDEVKEDLSEDGQVLLWRQLGEIARTIHHTRGATFGLPYPKQERERWSDALIDIAQGMLDDLIALDLDATGVAAYVALLDGGRHLIDEVDRPHLAHGDLWPKNVLIDRSSCDPVIVGLLDSERAFWGDPMAEWVFYFWRVPPAFWEGYGPRPDGAGAAFRAHAYAGLYSVQTFLEAWRFGYDDGFARRRLVASVDAMGSALAK